jgi:hypothetical protein
MIAAEKTQPEMLTYIFAAIVLITLLGGYGRQAIEWVLMKLYEFFIQRNPIKL